MMRNESIITPYKQSMPRMSRIKKPAHGATGIYQTLPSHRNNPNRLLTPSGSNRTLSIAIFPTRKAPDPPNDPNRSISIMNCPFLHREDNRSEAQRPQAKRESPPTKKRRGRTWFFGIRKSKTTPGRAAASSWTGVQPILWPPMAEFFIQSAATHMAPRSVHKLSIRWGGDGRS